MVDAAGRALRLPDTGLLARQGEGRMLPLVPTARSVESPPG